MLYGSEFGDEPRLRPAPSGLRVSELLLPLEGDPHVEQDGLPLCLGELTQVLVLVAFARQLLLVCSPPPPPPPPPQSDKRHHGEFSHFLYHNLVVKK